MTGGEAETRRSEKPVRESGKTQEAHREGRSQASGWLWMLRPRLAVLGFFRGEYHWETDRLVPSLDARLRVLVDHHNGIVTSEQVRAVERLARYRDATASTGSPGSV